MKLLLSRKNLYMIVILLTLLTGLSIVKMAPSISANDLMHIKSERGLMPPAYGISEMALNKSNSVNRNFSPAHIYENGSWVEVVSSGEWNDDQLLDAMLSTSFDFDLPNDNQATLFSQTVNGTLTSTLQLPTGINPMAMAPGDFNRDGLDDLAVVNKDDDTIGIFIQSAPGVMEEMVTYAAGAAPDGIAVGDFNTDLYQDIAVSHAISQTVAIYTQQEDGTFSEPQFIPVASGGFNDIDVGDLNHDGYDDLVLLRGAGQMTDHVAVFYQEAGELTSPIYLTTHTGGFQAHSLAVGDVTGDGRHDVVVTAGGNTPNAFLSVFPQTISGTITTTPIVYPAYHLPEAVKIGDINHDGRNDVVNVHAAWLSLSTYLQDGDGELLPYTSDSLPYNDFYRPGALDLGDVNNDGALDALVATHSSLPEENGLAVLTNQVTSAPTSRIITPALGIHLEGRNLITYTIAGTASDNAETLEISTDGGLTWRSQAATTEWSYEWTIPEENGSYIILTRAIDAAGRVQSPYARTRILVNHISDVFLPIITNGTPAPDLVVESITATANTVTAVIKNQGTAPVTDVFWIDAYIDPTTPPTAVNQIWDALGEQGLVWLVPETALPLAPGEALSVTLNGAYYRADISHIVLPLSADTPVYVQVDSAHTNTEYGNVLEDHEMKKDSYNNILGPVLVSP